MSAGARPSLSRRVMVRVMPVVFRIVNVPMRRILSLPRATPLGKRLMLVYLTGRKSGRHYRQPISLLGVMFAKNPMVSRFVPIPTREGHYDRERLNLAIRHGFCIARWTPHDPSARETIHAPRAEGHR
jgi:hypothetical protein